MPIYRKRDGFIHGGEDTHSGRWPVEADDSSVGALSSLSSELILRIDMKDLSKRDTRNREKPLYSIRPSSKHTMRNLYDPLWHRESRFPYTLQNYKSIYPMDL
jgi:hypothetical protein